MTRGESIRLALAEFVEAVFVGFVGVFIMVAMCLTVIGLQKMVEEMV